MNAPASPCERTPLVSVVMAAYNPGRYLPLAVESALAQTIRDVELLVIDDGSTDDTPRIIRHYLGDPRVRYERQANAGQCATKNNGIALARGEFIAFLDADDTWRPDKLERQLELFEGMPDVGVGYGYLERIDDSGRPVPWQPVPPRRGQVTEQLLLRNFVPFSASIVRTKLLRRHGGFDPELDMGIDYDLWLRLSMQCEFDYVDDVVGQYRVWAGQMSRKVRQRYVAGIQIMNRFLARHGGQVDAGAVAVGWAHTYVGRGNSLLWTERDWKGAWSDFFLALQYRPTYWPAYRSMLRSLLTQRPPRPGPSR